MPDPVARITARLHAEAIIEDEERTAAATPYCTGVRCSDCVPDEPCCEATCGPCDRADCFLSPGSEEGSKYCDEHGEG